MCSTSPTLYLQLVILVLLIIATDGSTENEFDRAFSKFLNDNHYSGGAVAAMQDGRLLLARGYGTDASGQKVKPSSKFHMSNVAKSMTGIAVLLLAQDGKISLQDKVFGNNGILKAIDPWKEVVDDRIYDITVDHLLHYSAGWDISKAPLFDVLMNKLYQKRHNNVPNIALEMGLEFPLKPREIISYVLSQSLSFAPGTSTAYSNIAYLVLGRVVEAASNMEYKDFIKKYILDPCGMWNTRQAISPHHQETNPHTFDKESSLFEWLDPTSVDSALGWYSNVFDMMRFVRCSFETGELLSDKYTNLMLGQLDSLPAHNSRHWFGAGFTVDSHGNVWQEADVHSDDLILYHRIKPRHNRERRMQELPDSWVVFLHGKSVNNIMDYTKDLMSVLDLNDLTANLFLYDLSDLHAHPNWQHPKVHSNPEYTVKYKVNEHHLVAYIDAVQDEGFNIAWLTSYTVPHNTFFLLVCKRIKQPIRSQYDYIFEHGLDHRQLLKRKLQAEESGYNMTLLHSYKSQAHNNPISFAAIFRHEAYSSDIQMKYGTGHLPEPYEKLVQMYYEKDFYPISQTVVYQNDEEQFSFIFIKEADSERTDFKHYYDLTENRLTKLTIDNAKINLHLSYLNSYDVAGKFRLAAIYTNATDSRGLLEIDETEEAATAAMISNLKRGLAPKYIVPSMSDDSRLHYVVYYEDV